jgi:hypothetical protein
MLLQEPIPGYPLEPGVPLPPLYALKLKIIKDEKVDDSEISALVNYVQAVHFTSSQDLVEQNTN